jgi:ABC-type phosphate transport system permease subunit
LTLSRRERLPAGQFIKQRQKTAYAEHKELKMHYSSYVSLALTWVLFLALFPLTFFWLRRAWRIFIKNDYSEVALKRGEQPANPKKWAPFTGTVNLVAGLFTLWTAFGVIALGYPYDKWSAMAGITIWGKIFADFILRQQAHPMVFGKKKKPAAAE